MTVYRHRKRHTYSTKQGNIMIRRSIAAIVLATALGGTVAAAPAQAYVPGGVHACNVTTTSWRIMIRDTHRLGYRVLSTQYVKKHHPQTEWTLVKFTTGAC